MRQITTHVVEGANQGQTLWADDSTKTAGGAPARYHLDNPGADGGLTIDFFQGPNHPSKGWVTNEILLAIVIDRLENFQKGDFACEDNAQALIQLQAGLRILKGRTTERLNRGVEGMLKR